jgi:hypothetical protein
MWLPSWRARRPVTPATPAPPVRTPTPTPRRIDVSPLASLHDTPAHRLRVLAGLRGQAVAARHTSAPAADRGNHDD